MKGEIKPLTAEVEAILRERLAHNPFVIFMGVGQVSDKLRNFQFKRLKYSWGGGLRFKFNKAEKVNIRMDIGFGKDTSGVYFGLEEAF